MGSLGNVSIDDLTNINGLSDIGTFATNYTNGLFFAIIILAIFFIIIIKQYQFGIERALAVSSFACLILSLPLMYLSMINPIFPIIFAVLLAGALAYIRFVESM